MTEGKKSGGLRDFIGSVVVPIGGVIIAIFAIFLIWYLGLRPHWIKANTEVEKKDLLEIQVQIDERQAVALERIADSLDLLMEDK
jgi:hypothetical protein